MSAEDNKMTAAAIDLDTLNELFDNQKKLDDVLNSMFDDETFLSSLSYSDQAPEPKGQKSHQSFQANEDWSYDSDEFSVKKSRGVTYFVIVAVEIVAISYGILHFT